MRTLLRHHVLTRDARSCVVAALIGTTDRCNPTLHVHHIIPVRDGGTDNPDNLVTVCAAHHGALEALRRKLTGQLPRCHHNHRTREGREECERRRRERRVAA